MRDFEVVIASPSDREELTAEIWYKEQMIAEINKEKSDLEIEFYIDKRITFDYESFCAILKIAKEKIQQQ